MDSVRRHKHVDVNGKPKRDLLNLLLLLVVFLLLFSSTVWYLLSRWREKVRTSTPLHVLSFPEIAAFLAFLLSYLALCYVQSMFLRPTIDAWSDDEDSCVEEVIETVPIPEEDEEIIESIVSGTTPSYALESKLGDYKRAASIRREAIQRLTGKSLAGLPIEGFVYDSILGRCCEMPVGYVQIPVGIAGPPLLDGREYSVPMATTEGCLVASTNRGCKAIFLSGRASSVLLRDGMTRAPIVRFWTAERVAELKMFLESDANFDTLADVFDSSSRFARLQSINCAIAGKNLYMRFTCSTGDAMGMNMVSKGVQKVIDFLQDEFPDMDVVGISGNFCSDKKAAAVNWIEGRGKSVVCEAVIKGEVVREVLKTSVEALVELNMLKNGWSSGRLQCPCQ